MSAKILSYLFGGTQMFTQDHFIWLGAIAAVIAIALIIIKRCNLPNSTVKKVAVILLILIKIFHWSIAMKESSHGGYVLKQSHLSFHLCGMMIYAIISTHIIKNEKFIRIMQSFIVPCTILGATMALLIPTAGVKITTPRVWEYMICHGVLIFYGLNLLLIEKVDLSFKAFVTNLKLLAGTAVFAFFMNSALEEYGPNFFFLRQPPMENLPILNLDHGWNVYIITLAIIACTLLFLIHLPFIIKDMKKKKQH